MLKQHSFVIFWIFFILSLLSCQTNSSDEKITKADTLTIQGLKILVEKQISAIDKLLEKNKELDNTSLFLYGNNDISDNNEDVNFVSPIKSEYELTADRKTLERNLKKNVRSDGIEQYFEYPQSVVVVYPANYNTNKILNTDEDELGNINTTLKRIFYCDGTISASNTSIKGAAKFSLSNAKSIDSITCCITYKYQSRSCDIVLNEENPSFRNEDGYIDLIKINKKEAYIITSKSFHDDKVEIRGITNSGMALKNISSWNTMLLNNEGRQSISAYQEELKNILENIAKYSSAENLRSDLKLVAHQSSVMDAIKEKYLYKSSLLFSSDITGLNISLLRADSISIDVTIPNNKTKPYYIVDIPPKEEIAIIDRMGEIMASNITENLKPILGSYFEDIDTGKLYRLNTKTKKVESCPFKTGTIYKCEIDNNIYPIEDENNKAGIADMNGKIILPTKYRTIYYCIYKGYILTLIDGNDSSYTIQGLYKTDGTLVVPEEYANIDIKGNYAYASRMKDGKYRTDKFLLK